MSRRSLLVLNAGSSSLKFSLFKVKGENPQTFLSGTATGLTVNSEEQPRLKVKCSESGEVLCAENLISPTYEAAVSAVARFTKSFSRDAVSCVGHRVVHGGSRFTSTCLVDDPTLSSLASLSPLAPLHNPHNVAGIEAAREHFPSAHQVAVFDTAFHSTIPAHAHTYPLPARLAAKYRRYGFHGTSHKFVVSEAARFLGKEKINAISFHLGNGCSVCCVKDGQSVDTSMGFTPLAGLPMGTRSGDLDPSIVLQMIEEEGLSVREASDVLHNMSGLYGISGTSDSLTVEKGYERGDEACVLAFDMFAHSARKFLGAYTEVLQGDVDCVIFTGGVGENSALLRRLICRPGSLATVTRYNVGAVRDVSRDHAQRPRVLVVNTDEQLAIARECLECVKENSL